MSIQSGTWFEMVGCEVAIGGRTGSWRVKAQSMRSLGGLVGASRERFSRMGPTQLVGEKRARRVASRRLVLWDDSPPHEGVISHAAELFGEILQTQRNLWESGVIRI